MEIQTLPMGGGLVILWLQTEQADSLARMLGTQELFASSLVQVAFGSLPAMTLLCQWGIRARYTSPIWLH